jgi:hypothetical protein
VAGRTVALAVGDGARLRLWVSRDAGGIWQAVRLPGGASDGGDSRLAVGLADGELLVAVGTGDRGGVWTAELPH